MFHKIIINSFLIFISFLHAQQNIVTEPDSIPVYWMNEIVVTDNRLPVTMQASMYEMGREEIDGLDAAQPATILSFVPGLHVTRMAKNETTFKLRGFEQRQVSVFLDGVPISVPYDGYLDLSQLLGDNLETIRVARSASSSLYGKNTLGGSINIMSTDFADPTQLRARIEGSNHQRYLGTVNYHKIIDDLAFAVNFAYEKGDDFRLSEEYKKTVNENGNKRENSSFEKINAAVKLQYNISSNHSLGFNYNLLDNSFNIPIESETSRPRYWQFPQWRKNVLSMNSKHIFSDWFLLRSTVYYDTYYNLLKSYDDADYSTQEQRWAWNSTYDDHSKGIILYPSFNLFNFGSSNFILSYKNDVHKEEFRDFGFDKYETASWTAGLEQDIRVTEKDMFAVGLDASYLEALHAADLSLRDPILLYNGHVMFQHRFENNLATHASFAKKTRFPTLKELYSERLGRAIANPELKEEKTLNFEIGLKYQMNENLVQVSAFRYNLTDLIVPIELGNETEQMQNIGKARFQGIELDSRFKLGKFNVLANYTFMQVENLTKNRESKYLEYRPKHQANLIGQWRFLDNMHFALESNYTSHQYFNHPVTLAWKKFNDVVLVNLKYSYQVFNYLKWYLRFNNALDNDYASEYGVPSPGREIITGIKFAL